MQRQTDSPDGSGMPFVRVFDTTLRDGEQTPGVFLSVEEKVEVARRLEAFGVVTIEAGFPVSSPSDRAAVTEVARVVRGCEVAAMARCVPGDVEAAAEALQDAAAPVIHVFLSTSDIHLTKKLRMGRAEAIRAIESCVGQARSRVARVQFSAEDATRTERAFLRQCIEVAIRAGASRINVPDTVGWHTPEEYGAMIRDIVAFVAGEAVVSAHCHDDLGMATANTVAAVQNGARQIEVTVNGIGERAGNAAAEEVAVVLARREIARTGIRLEQVTELSRHVAVVTGVPVQPNRAIVGANAFAHSSGIHQDGVLKAAETYETVPPNMVGAAGHRFVLTARSGRKAVAHVARTMGAPLTSAELEVVYAEVMAMSETIHGAVNDDALARIIGRHGRSVEERESTALA
jgi:2-isopropylmalate synthase